MKETLKPDNHRKYDAAFRAEALRLARESRFTLVAARAWNIDAKQLYSWQKAGPIAVWSKRPKCGLCARPKNVWRRNWTF